MEEAKPQILLWTAPECPFRVTLAVQVINEIRILAVEAFYSVPRGGVEIGGVFFGVRERDAIHIQAHRPIRCQYATGPSFTLSIDDQLGLSGLLENAPDDPDLTEMYPVGWYHSHNRSEIFLSPADLQLYNDFFHERWQIAMVLRPANLHPTRAAIFFRDRTGSLKSDAPGQEFKLEPPTFGLTLLDAPDGTAVLPPPPAYVAPPVVPSVIAAPQTPPPVASPVAPPPPAVIEPLPVAAAAPSAVIAPEPAPAVMAAAVAAATGNGAVAVLPEPSLPKIPDIALQPAAEPDLEKLVELGLHSFNLAESKARDKRRTGWIRALLVIILLIVGGGIAFLKWGRLPKAEGLGLETYDINGAFLIRWDRESPAVRSATHAVLEIEDGGEKIPAIDLNNAELAIGGRGYMRRTSQVLVRMKVDGPSPVEEYSNFKTDQALGSQPPQSADASKVLNEALQEKEHLKTELINESMQSSELRREITSLRRQLAEERAKSTSAPER